MLHEYCSEANSLTCKQTGNSMYATAMIFQQEQQETAMRERLREQCFYDHVVSRDDVS